jgi:hypothetical protein
MAHYQGPLFSQYHTSAILNAADSCAVHGN